MTLPIADLHCDLLEYLESDSNHTAFDAAALCSIPQLKAGGVFMQTLAIYTTTNEGSVKSGLGQAAIFQTIDSKYPDHFLRIRSAADIARAKTGGKIGVIAAIENASGFASEEEPLEKALKRLDEMITLAAPLLYISLTHFPENRFCGGNATPGVGLKEDGKELLRYLSGKKIAVDLSHTSDDSAHDILNCITQYRLDIPIIASHSNFRTVTDHARNLPDELVQEVIKRRGLIGLNFVAEFIGKRGVQDYLRQINYALKIGAEKALCLGADFFHTADGVKALGLPSGYQFFHQGFDSSACYPSFVDLLEQKGHVSSDVVQDITSQNVIRFLNAHILPA